MTLHTPHTLSTPIRCGLGIPALGLLAAAVLSACGGGDAVKPPADTTAAPANTTICVADWLWIDATTPHSVTFVMSAPLPKFVPPITTS